MRVMLSGNEAIARGAYEYGVEVAMGYPGTPSSEILENVARYREIYSEWSINEKVAMDGVMGAAYAGKRAMFTTKQVGMNVASDSFLYGVYTGANAGVLIVTADDPGMFSSQNEQDNRHYARLAKMPIIEPADSQEAKDFVGLALNLSEQFDEPVILRTVMRIAHSASPVELGERRAPSRADRPAAASEAGRMKRDPHKFVATAVWARGRRPLIEARIATVAEYAETLPENRIEWGDRGLGIITSGVVYHYSREVFPSASFLKLALTWPIPPRLVREFAAGVERVIVIEELDPFIEEQVRLLGIPAAGKSIFPSYGELLPATIERCAIAAGLLPAHPGAVKRSVPPADLPARSPILCPGCPHRSTFYTLNKLKYVVAGDIGCYNLGALPPFDATDTMGAMGASIGVAHGFHAAGLADRSVAVIGDGTFFHSGMAPLLNMVHNNSKGTIVILDNRTTAMTGHQDHPGVAQTLAGAEGGQVNIADLCRAMGVKDVRVVDAFDMEAVQRNLKETVACDGLSVIVMDGPCVFVELERKAPFEVDADLCNGCTLCFRLGCPAIFRADELDARTGRPKAGIDPVLCVSCDMCRQICPRKAIFMPTQAMN
ncbi:MAG: indolepyruvate ferredoxin oxidoreductase [Chloroflexi bacterium]|nr:indolepyruvate ferredoxin oxidoreductase [Chloroflexota bacterium]